MLRRWFRRASSHGSQAPRGRVPRGMVVLAVEDGETLCRSRQPFLDTARELLARGQAPETVLEATHLGSRTVAMRSTVGEAARWAITGGDGRGYQRRGFTPYDGPCRASVAHEKAEEPPGAVDLPDEAIARPRRYG
jgi:hypothetical protein